MQAVNRLSPDRLVSESLSAYKRGWETAFHEQCCFHSEGLPQKFSLLLRANGNMLELLSSVLSTNVFHPQQYNSINTTLFKFFYPMTVINAFSLHSFSLVGSITPTHLMEGISLWDLFT